MKIPCALSSCKYVHNMQTMPIYRFCRVCERPIDYLDLIMVPGLPYPSTHNNVHDHHAAHKECAQEAVRDFYLRRLTG